MEDHLMTIPGTPAGEQKKKGGRKLGEGKNQGGRGRKIVQSKGELLNVPADNCGGALG